MYGVSLAARHLSRNPVSDYLPLKDGILDHLASLKPGSRK